MSATDFGVKGNEILENCCGFRKPLCGWRERMWRVVQAQATCLSGSSVFSTGESGPADCVDPSKIPI